jgi:excisionase family DNA binding protein
MTIRTLPHPLLVSFEEAARILGGDRPVSVRHVERLVKAKKLRAVGQGRARRVKYDSLLKYIESEGGDG